MSSSPQARAGQPEQQPAPHSATAKQNILGLIDSGRQVRRPPLVGMQFLHDGPVGARDVVGPRSGLKAKDLIGLLFRHFSAARPSAAVLPRSRITLRVFTPAGLPAVKIRRE
jgi:hypothetical protein